MKAVNLGSQLMPTKINQMVNCNLRPFQDLLPKNIDFQDFSRPGKGAFEISDILRLFKTPREP